MSFDKLQTVRVALKSSLVDRDEAVDMFLCALIAKEHVLLLGPPGTAKSMLSTLGCSSIKGFTSFKYLVSKFTTPDEIFGPLSISKLQEDQYLRIIDGKLPDCNIAFIDEIFKANSAILNNLLTIIEERQFDHGNKRIDVPLNTVVAASNEMPEKGLEALFDRFCFRLFIDRLDDDHFAEFMTRAVDGFNNELPVSDLLTQKDVKTMQDAAAKIKISEELISEVKSLRHQLSMKGIIPSDRKWGKALKCLRAYAYLLGDDTATPKHMECLINVLWDHQEQIPIVTTIVGRLADRFTAELRDISDVISSIYPGDDEVKRLNKDDLQELGSKLLQLRTRLENLGKDYPGNVDQVDKVLTRVANLMKKATDYMFSS